MIQNAPYSKKSFINSIDSMSELDKIKLKNNVNKIITAYKKHKKKNIIKIQFPNIPMKI